MWKIAEFGLSMDGQATGVVKPNREIMGVTVNPRTLAQEMTTLMTTNEGHQVTTAAIIATSPTIRANTNNRNPGTNTNDNRSKSLCRQPKEMNRA